MITKPVSIEMVRQLANHFTETLKIHCEEITPKWKEHPEILEGCMEVSWAKLFKGSRMSRTVFDLFVSYARQKLLKGEMDKINPVETQTLIDIAEQVANEEKHCARN